MILAGVGAMLCFAGCNSVGDKPEDVVLAVLKAAQSGKADQEFLNKYCEEDTAKLFAGHEMIDTLKGAEFSVSSVFVDDDIAVVTILQLGGERDGFSYYDARKVDEQWRIQLNTKEDADSWCVSQKTIHECVEAFKTGICTKGEVKYIKHSTLTFCTDLYLATSKLSLEKFEEMKKALNGLKIKGYKRISDSIWVELEMPWKDGSMKRGELEIGVRDGKWTNVNFSNFHNFFGIER